MAPKKSGYHYKKNLSALRESWRLKNIRSPGLFQYIESYRCHLRKFQKENLFRKQEK